MIPSPSGEIVTFYSYKGGTGRSMALANTAWVLASNGLRVLAVDWDLESPGLHRYFHPFLVDRDRRALPGVLDLVWDFSVAAMAPTVDRLPSGGRSPADEVSVMRYAVSLDRTFPGGGTLDFVPSGHGRPAYETRVSEFDWGVLYERQGGGAFVEALAADMRAHYDVTLIDSRTGLSDTAGICTIALPDVLVNCFTMSTQAIEGALSVAASVRAQAPHVRILPVPMRIEDAEKEKLEAGRDHVRSRFAPYLDDRDPDAQERYWGDIEVPYKAFYAYEEVLATVGDRPKQEGTLLAAYERLVGVLTGGRVTELVPLPEAERRRRLADFTRRRLSTAWDVFISHAEQDRMWADWIAHQLRDAGHRVVRQGTDFRPGADVGSEVERAVDAAACTIVVLSPDYVESAHARRTWATAVARDPGGVQGVLLPLRVADFRPTGPFADRVPVDLVGLTERQAREHVLAAMKEPGTEQPPPAGQGEDDATDEQVPRYPGEEPRVFEVPPRNANFVGRDPVLVRLRASLADAPAAAVLPHALQGLGGVGKTQVAQEYAHRYAPDYDLVWWVPSEQVAEARAALLALAPYLGIDPSRDAAETLRLVQAALARGRPFRRWLLVFDNAEEPDGISALLPRGPGHVLITSRNQEWSSRAGAIQVDSFARDESVALLLRRCRDITPEQADRLAERLGDLPLALEQAAIWLAETGMPVSAYIDLVDEQLARLLEEGDPPTYPSTVGATWSIAFDRLEARSSAAMQLLELCAFFGAEPIPFRMLDTARIAAPVPSPLAETAADPILRRKAVGEIGRYALARAEPGRDTVVVHRLVQAVLRDHLSPQERATFRAVAHDLLAAFNPGAPDDDTTWEDHAALSPHIVPAGAIDSARTEVRQVVVDQLRYRYRRGDFEGCLELAEAARTAWLATDGPDDEQLLLVNQLLTDALWGLGEVAAARELRSDTFERMRRVLGDDHVETLVTANAVGADLRVSGKFREAQAHDEHYLARHRATLGLDDRRTLSSANNLAVDLRLAGDFHAALALDEDTLARRRNASPLRDEAHVLNSVAGLAQDLIGAGRYGEARDLLARALDDVAEDLGARHHEVLHGSRTLTQAVRKAGDFQRGRSLADELLDLHRERFGSGHLDTIAAMTSAAHARRSTGDLDGAREIGEEVVSRYRTVLGKRHPFTFAASSNLGIVLRSLGDVDAASRCDVTAHAGLEATVGSRHPFTLACSANIASDLHLSGDARAAVDRSRLLVAISAAVRGADHPDTLRCALNLSIDLVKTGSSAEADRAHSELLGRYRAVLGPSHPDTFAAESRQRAEFEIEPPDL